MKSIPANPAITEPITRAWSFAANTFLPSDLAATSSSRIALSMRPQGLFTRRHTSNDANTTSVQPTSIAKSVF